MERETINLLAPVDVLEYDEELSLIAEAEAKVKKELRREKKRWSKVDRIHTFNRVKEEHV